ncbi:MAG: pyrimidine/purine nucleoside phosphorylase [Snodgrassella sp.]|jgi:purine/pyrimidine-nucleoside phosphorylase|nr:pyrimidine/purine nucleoside phosphorylase [Snodgrassella sp.]
MRINEYFDGKVISISMKTATLPATVGVMQPGDYTFSTERLETMKVISGALSVLLPGSNDWRIYHENEEFEVAAGEKFAVKVLQDTAYFCTYGQK